VLEIILNPHQSINTPTQLLSFYDKRKRQIASIYSLRHFGGSQASSRLHDTDKTLQEKCTLQITKHNTTLTTMYKKHEKLQLTVYL